MIWPEHFDLAITLDKVNYGISPGDAAISAPYAYIGPWQLPDGDFWNAPFGAMVGYREVASVKAAADFFHNGHDRARQAQRSTS